MDEMGEMGKTITNFDIMKNGLKTTKKANVG